MDYSAHLLRCYSDVYVNSQPRLLSLRILLWLLAKRLFRRHSRASHIEDKGNSDSVPFDNSLPVLTI